MVYEVGKARLRRNARPIGSFPLIYGETLLSPIGRRYYSRGFITFENYGGDKQKRYQRTCAAVANEFREYLTLLRHVMQQHPRKALAELKWRVQKTEDWPAYWVIDVFLPWKWWEEEDEYGAIALWQRPLLDDELALFQLAKQGNKAQWTALMMELHEN